ncbi:hypothetical protein IEO21_08839 [Rhodonia placenta]|uniref:DUF6533 domain-containing protein n=1 Tax=Rhodonia placenta TaxID=104341 RepID=A0A8H7NVL1_9APHY|nr:hypothetical protein IEO21_08839 [Postia placenta]
MSAYVSLLVNITLADVKLGLFVYDSIVSFDMEWRAVWSRKITGATALYVALRYVTLLNVIMIVIYSSVPSCEGHSYCLRHIFRPSMYVYLHFLVQQSNPMWLIAFASIRVYAIDSRRWMRAAIVMMLGLMPVVINIYGASKTVMTHTAEGCFLGYSYSTFRSHIICVLISNLLVVISTWQATRTSRAVTSGNSRGSLTTMLFRHGTVHFALVVGLNTADLLVTLLLGVGVIDTAMNNKISTVVLCHFFLNLRYFSSLELNDSTISSLGSPSLSFASRIIGNLGEMLVEDSQAYDDDVDRELEDPTDSEEVDAAVDLDDNGPANSAKAPSTSRMATTASCKLETHEEPAAACEPLAAQDEGIEQRTIHLVYVGAALQAR